MASCPRSSATCAITSRAARPRAAADGVRRGESPRPARRTLRRFPDARAKFCRARPGRRRF